MMQPEAALEKLLFEDGVDVSASAHITGQRITEDNTQVIQQILSQLSEDFPPESSGWVKSAQWIGPIEVPADEVDFSNEKNWRAYHEPEKIAMFRQKIQNGYRKPVILVQTPGNPKKIIIDGHHRSMAFRDEGRPIVAFVGKVAQDKGPWDEMHAAQYKGSSGLMISEAVARLQTLLREDVPPEAAKTEEQSLAIRKKVDLIDLPQEVVGKNCANCKYIDADKDYCENPEVKLPVNDRMGCKLWDRDDIDRPWDRSAVEESVQQLSKLLEADGRHAPAGGVKIAGTFYKGGEFIPGEVAGSEEGKRALKAADEKAAEGEAGEKTPKQGKGYFSKYEKAPDGLKEGDTYTDKMGIKRTVFRSKYADGSDAGLWGQADMSHKELTTKLNAEMSRLSAEKQKALTQWAQTKTDELKKDRELSASVADWNMYRDMLLFAYINSHRWNKRFQQERGLSEDKAQRAAAALSNLDHIIGLAAYTGAVAGGAQKGGIVGASKAAMSPGGRMALVPWATLAYLTMQGVRHPTKVLHAAGKVVGSILHRAHKDRPVERKWLAGRQRREALPGGPAAPRGRPRRPGTRIGDVITDPTGAHYTIKSYVPGYPTLARATDKDGDLVDVDIYKRRRVHRRNPNIQDSVDWNSLEPYQKLSHLLEQDDPAVKLRFFLEEQEEAFGSLKPEEVDMVVDALEEHPDDWFATLLLTSAGEMDDIESAIDLAEDAYMEVPKPPLEATESVDWAVHRLQGLLAV